MSEAAIVNVILDSEALSVLAHPDERGSSRRRSRLVARTIAELGGLGFIPAPVLAEVSHGRRSVGIHRVIKEHVVINTNPRIALRAGDLLHRNGLGSEHAVDAFVAATAIECGASVILTCDPDDMRRLVGRHPATTIRSID